MIDLEELSPKIRKTFKMISERQPVSAIELSDQLREPENRVRVRVHEMVLKGLINHDRDNATYSINPTGVTTRRKQVKSGEAIRLEEQIHILKDEILKLYEEVELLKEAQKRA